MSGLSFKWMIMCFPGKSCLPSTSPASCLHFIPQATTLLYHQFSSEALPQGSIMAFQLLNYLDSFHILKSLQHFTHLRIITDLRNSKVSTFAFASFQACMVFSVVGRCSPGLLILFQCPGHLWQSGRVYFCFSEQSM